MPEPFLQLEQTHRLFCIEQLRGDRRASSVTRDGTSHVNLRDAGLSTELGNEILVEKTFSERPHPVNEQEVHHLPSFLITQLRLRWTSPFPRVDGLPYCAIHRFCEIGSRLADRNVQKAHGGATIFLPSHTSDAESSDFITTKAGEEPDKCHGTRHLDGMKGMNLPVPLLASCKVLRRQVQSRPKKFCPHIVGDHARGRTDKSLHRAGRRKAAIGIEPRRDNAPFLQIREERSHRGVVLHLRRRPEWSPIVSSPTPRSYAGCPPVAALHVRDHRQTP